MQENTSHLINLENMQQLNATGVLEVMSFSETQITLKVVNNLKLIITGSMLKIISFNKQTGVLQLLGTVSNLKYLDKQQSILKRLTK